MRASAKIQMTLAVALIATASGHASAQTPAPSASPSASPQPAQGLRVSADGFTTFENIAASGPGLTPPEGPGFSNGSPLSPMTDYDTWSSAPQTPGISAVAQLNLTGTFTGSKYFATAIAGIAGLTGSMQSAAYWSENLFSTLNPHLGYTAIPYAIVFPTHAGQDDASATIVSPVFGSFGPRDGTWLVRAGFFDLAQTERFVFAAPPLTNVTPAIGIAAPETLGNGPPSLDSWPTPEPGLPLHGVDISARRGIASLEVANAALPALPGTSARATIASVVVDHGEGTRFSAMYLHAATGGDLIATTTMYGAGAATNPGPQGPLPTSTLGGQEESIAGIHAGFHVGRETDALAEIGRTWYDATDVLEPGTNAPGGFYHLEVSARHGRGTYSIDGYRFEARYANMILPYGTPENVWSVAWSWPGVWLKSTYQLVDNLQYPGSNRQGYRLKYALDKGPLEIHASLAGFHQIDTSALSNVQQTGFVDGFFLPQADNAATLGEQHQYAAWVAWHTAAGDVTLDYVNDVMHRGFAAEHPEDYVSYQAPQAILTFAHRFGSDILADAGFGRYAMNGSFAQPYTNVDFFQNVYFAGVELNESSHAMALVQMRRSAFAGVPSSLGGASPNFQATSLVIEQRFR